MESTHPSYLDALIFSVDDALAYQARFSTKVIDQPSQDHNCQASNLMAKDLASKHITSDLLLPIQNSEIGSCPTSELGYHHWCYIYKIRSMPLHTRFNSSLERG